MLDVLVAPIIDESLNASLQSCIVLPSKDIYEEPFGYHSGNCSPIILEKRIQILFWEYTQPLVLYWLYKARYCNLPHTIKIPSLVDDGEYRFTLMMMDFNALFNIYAWTSSFVWNYNTRYRNQPSNIIFYGKYLGCITTSHITILIPDNNHGYINLAVTHTR